MESVGVVGEEKSVCHVTWPLDGSPFAAGAGNDSGVRVARFEAGIMRCVVGWLFEDDIVML